MATENATIAATNPTTGRVHGNAGLMQAYALRQLAFDLAREIGLAKPEELDETLRARANSVASLIRAWSEADERGRIARGRPLPGSLRPEAKTKRKGSRHSLWAEPAKANAEPTIAPSPASEHTKSPNT
jgi:hypothetical protein